ncbi:MAG: S-layer homology domain-containing protein [Candidatus Saganbacteria bacterium]|nr:S-layer homology domain-containing protein [Candidatus Saganbacteria bacterium]
MKKVLFGLLIYFVFLGLCLPKGAEALLLENGIDPLMVELGAYPISMGNAVTAYPNVTSLFYNPGAIAWSQGVVFTGQGFDNFAIGEIYPFAPGHRIAFGLVADTYKNLETSGGGKADYSARIATVSYGVRLKYIPFLGQYFKDMSFGVKLKSILSTTFSETGQLTKSTLGYDLDVGGLWLVNPSLTLGVWGKNVMPLEKQGAGELRWDSGEREGIPASVILGVAGRIMGANGLLYRSDKDDILLTMDYDSSYKYARPSLLRAGVEWARRGMYAVRAGFSQDYDGDEVVSGATAGIGIERDDWKLDLGYRTEPLTKTPVLQFSVTYSPWEWVIEEKVVPAKPTEEAKVPAEVKYQLAEAITYDETYIITGEAKPGVDIFVNDNRAYLDAKGRYAVVVPLYPEKNLMYLEGRINGEKVFAIEYKVLRKAKVLISGERALIEEESRITTLRSKFEEEKATLEKELAKKPEKKAEIEKKLNEINIQLSKADIEQKSFETNKKQLEQRKGLVENLVSMGVVEISPDTEFALEAPVTRRELVTWLVRAAEIPLPKVDRDVYVDIKKDSPFAPYARIAADTGMLLGYPDGTFRPDAPVTAAEGEKIFKKFGII